MYITLPLSQVTLLCKNPRLLTLTQLYSQVHINQLSLNSPPPSPSPVSGAQHCTRSVIFFVFRIHM